MSIYPPLKFWERESDRETDPVRYEELLKKEEQEDMLAELETLRALKITPRREALKMIPTNAITLDKDPGYSARKKKESARKKKEPASRKKKMIPSNASYRNEDPDYCDRADREREKIARRKNTVQNVPEKITFWWAPPQRGYHKLNVNGSKRGGYGAILRDDDGNPIAAVAGVSQPVSTLFHELQGVEEGLLVALKHIDCGTAIVRIEVSEVYPAQVVGGYQSLYEKDDIPLVHDIINRIRILMSEISFCVIDSCPKGTNNAAACLSELLQTDEFKTVEYDVKKLPEELNVIVKEEAARPSPWK